MVVIRTLFALAFLVLCAIGAEASPAPMHHGEGHAEAHRLESPCPHSGSSGHASGDHDVCASVAGHCGSVMLRSESVAFALAALPTAETIPLPAVSLDGRTPESELPPPRL